MRKFSKLRARLESMLLALNERPSKAFLNLENAKKGYNEVILLNKDNSNYDPTKAEREEISYTASRILRIAPRRFKNFWTAAETQVQIPH